MKSITFTLFLLTLSLCLFAQTESEPNNAIGEADVVTLGTTIQGSINPAGDSDYYEFETTEIGFINIDITNIPAQMDMRIELYSANQSFLSSESFIDQSTLNHIKFVCTLGTYYLRLSDIGGNDFSTQNYSLTISQFNDDIYECNNTFEDATPIALNQIIDAPIRYRGDEDFYEFEVSEAGFLNIGIKNISTQIDMNVRLYSANQSFLSSESFFDQSTLNHMKFVCLPGIYYLQLSDNGGNNFSTQKYNLVISQSNDDVYECNNTFDEATTIALGQTIQAQIHDLGDNDYYQIETTEAGIFEVEINNIAPQVDMHLFLYDAFQNEIKNESVSNSSILSFKQSVCESGIYYFRLKDVGDNNSNAQLYNLTINLDTSDIYECNNSFEDAATIPLGQTIQAQIHDLGDNDYYQIETTEAGIFEIKINNIANDIDMQISIYDTNKDFVAQHSYTSVTNIDLTQIACEPGIYYFRLLDHFNNGSSSQLYELTISLNTEDTQDCHTLNIPTFTNNIRYYPNPVNDFLMLELPNEENTVIIYDLMGKKIADFRAVRQHFKLNMTGFKKGEYLFQVLNKNGKGAVRLIK